MGSCFQSSSQVKHQTLSNAYSLFHKIAIGNPKIINRQAVQQYFSSYTQSCYDILMRQIDINKDGFISLNQWMAYWQYVRMAGYDYAKINKQLNRIQKGQVTLDFPKTKSFRPNQSRITLLHNIISNMKSDQAAIPFLQNLPTKSS